MNQSKQNSHRKDGSGKKLKYLYNKTKGKQHKHTLNTKAGKTRKTGSKPGKVVGDPTNKKNTITVLTTAKNER